MAHGVYNTNNKALQGYRLILSLRNYLSSFFYRADRSIMDY